MSCKDGSPTDMKLLKKILHFCLLVLILLIFSKLTLDAVLLGAIAMYFYNTREAKQA